ncbi:MAG: hypothetical protein KJ624_03910 [Chloroflexi bacterium]|nr:hypothetical protein [Chloroflexota bacterium]
MKKEPFPGHVPLPPALLRLAAVLMDIAVNEAKAPVTGEMDRGHLDIQSVRLTSPSPGTTMEPMAFIRAKVSRGKTYYYLVENHREGKKVRQKVLKYLGTKPPEGWQPKKKEDK